MPESRSFASQSPKNGGGGSGGYYRRGKIQWPKLSQFTHQLQEQRRSEGLQVVVICDRARSITPNCIGICGPARTIFTIWTNPCCAQCGRTIFYHTMMKNCVIIADLGLEGGGATIFGTQIDSLWSFWLEGSSMTIDGNEEDEWKTWTSERVADLSAIVPDMWPLMFPCEVHPEFTGWFLDHYEAARANLPDDLRQSQEEYRHAHWQRVFEGEKEALY